MTLFDSLLMVPEGALPSLSITKNLEMP